MINCPELFWHLNVLLQSLQLNKTTSLFQGLILPSILKLGEIIFDFKPKAQVNYKYFLIFKTIFSRFKSIIPLILNLVK